LPEARKLLQAADWPITDLKNVSPCPAGGPQVPHRLSNTPPAQSRFALLRH
jgi:hypothetical protein